MTAPTAELIARLKDYLWDDHERGCAGRNYSCSCEYESKLDPLIEEAATALANLDAMYQNTLECVSNLEQENKRLRDALQRLVTDYEDVPDPTDKDGQAVFADARAALQGKETG